MSESEATVEAVETSEGDSTTEPFDEARAREKIKKTNAEAAALRKRVKALEAYEAQAQEAEQAKLSETERFAAQLADVTRRAEAAESRLLRNTVARRAGLPDDLADRLQGDDEEALTADAARLAELFGVAQEAASAQQKPARRGDPSQGSDALALNGDPLEQSLRNAVGAR